MSAATAWSSARDEWSRNARLRWGVGVIALVIGVWVFLVLRDWRDALAEEYLDRHAYLVKMQSLVGQDEWLERAEAAARIRAALEAEIPLADTIGIAQATVQTWARDLVAASGAELQVQAQAAQEVEGHPGLFRVPVVISGGLQAPKVMELIRQVESYGSLAVIEESLIMNRQNETFSLTVVAYFQVQEGVADAGA
ncbi:hypothetical protein [Novilysobacter spongiicola]|uniref:Uncharacterized protein n=1 Tax=Lysobacter spongiicola DSM 21749 TaxID=1122188 RepID=A0A1T4PER7_9GAMM|nr:hypothetical protein [Lysobacter spongiicola]SJZ90050.1 hypothetical protein SAMN02745674_01158 [Lysobacter spongiicola DSM 21749]